MLGDSRSVGLLALALALGGCVRFLQTGTEPVADRSAPDRPASDAAALDRSIADRPGPDAKQLDAPGLDAKKLDVKKLDAKLPDLKKLDAKPPDAKPPDAKKPDLPPATVPGVWVTVPAGTFSMGSPAAEGCRAKNETLHTVTLGAAYSIQSTEVTQAQFLEVLGYNPSYHVGCGGDCPVETVSWSEAAAYCNALSVRKGYAKCYACTGSKTTVSCAAATSYAGASFYGCPGYRLPTEAEWEKAYRAGSTSGYYNAPVNPSSCGTCSPIDPNVDAIAWTCGNASGTTHPVAKKLANTLGLHDLAGNVSEWCNDGYQPDLGSAAVTNPWGSTSDATRVARGGSYFTNSADVRAAAREHYPPTDRAAALGFRCVRTK